MPQLIAEGAPDKQVAGELGISTKTVEKHRQNLMAKLNIHEISGLTRYAATLRSNPLSPKWIDAKLRAQKLGSFRKKRG